LGRRGGIDVRGKRLRLRNYGRRLLRNVIPAFEHTIPEQLHGAGLIPQPIKLRVIRVPLAH